MTFSHALSSNNYGPAKFIVDASAANGTHTTIAAALTSASSGDTIFIRPGTYTENLTLKAGVNLSAYVCDASTPNVSIVGKATFTAVGTVSISGIRLTTNSDFFLAVTGSNASIVNLTNCYLNCLNNTGISLTSSSASAQVTAYTCTGNLGTTGIGIYSHSSNGSIAFQFCSFSNTGGSSTASSNSAGTAFVEWSNMACSFSSSGTGQIGCYHSNISNAANNATVITTSGSANGVVRLCLLESGSASCVSIGTGTQVSMDQCSVNSSNTNAITGLGEASCNDISFPGVSKTNNATTQNIAVTTFGSTTTAPGAGGLGESITSSATAVGLTSPTAKNVTSITLTPGVWDVSALVQFVPGGATNTTIFSMSISTTTGTLTGNIGDTDATFTYGSGILSLYLALSVPRVRAVVTTNTTYYLVAASTFTVSTQSVNGRISATRVG